MIGIKKHQSTQKKNTAMDEVYGIQKQTLC